MAFISAIQNAGSPIGANLLFGSQAGVRLT
jgi:serine/threonine protein phosphatase PrpC